MARNSIFISIDQTIQYCFGRFKEKIIYHHSTFYSIARSIDRMKLSFLSVDRYLNTWNPELSP